MSTTTSPEMRAREQAFDPRLEKDYEAKLDLRGGRTFKIAGAVTAAALALAVAFAAGQATATTDPRPDTFTDVHGRVCTTTGGSGIDCDFPPAEDRFGGFLDGLSTIPPSSTN